MILKEKQKKFKKKLEEYCNLKFKQFLKIEKILKIIKK